MVTMLKRLLNKIRKRVAPASGKFSLPHTSRWTRSSDYYEHCTDAVRYLNFLKGTNSWYEKNTEQDKEEV